MNPGEVWFDVTRARRGGPSSGLSRVARRLDEEGRALLGARWCPVWWDGPRRVLRRAADGRRLSGPGRFLTAELFAEDERPGFVAAITAPGWEARALFHDAIPLRFPEWCRPHAVARHSSYLAALGRFSAVWADSAASRSDLVAWWRWLGLEGAPPVTVVRLGADGGGEGRRRPDPERQRDPGAGGLCVGALEPRKGQLFLVEILRGLLAEGLNFNFVFAGRAHEDLGAPIVAAVREAEQASGGRIRWVPAPTERTLAGLWERASFSAFPSRAEGAGLPVGESLWKGVPCLASDLPVLREWGEAGVRYAAPEDAEAWRRHLRWLVTDPRLHATLAFETAGRPLPVWSETARTLLTGWSCALPTGSG